MKRNIKSIIAKGKWTGAEVGKLLILNFINDMEHHKQGITEYEPLFSQAEFNKMVNSLETERQITAYQVYIAIYKFINDGYNKCQAYEQQFQNGFFRYKNALVASIDQENRIRDILKQPLIMTQGDYDRYSRLAEEQSRSVHTDYISIFRGAVEHYAYLYGEGRTEEIPQAVLEALEALKEEDTNREGVLKLYREASAEEVEVLPDGTRSTDTDKDEWHRLYLEANAKLRGLSSDLDEEAIKVALAQNELDRVYKLFEVQYRGIQWLLDTFKLKKAERDSIATLLELDEATLIGIFDDIQQWESCHIYPAIEPYEEGIRTLEKVLCYGPVISYERNIDASLVCNKLEALEVATEYYFECRDMACLTDEEEKDTLLEEIRQTVATKGIAETLKAYADTAPSLFYRLYPAENTEDAMNGYREFIEDYPTLSKAVVDAMSVQLPGFADIPIEWVHADIFGWGFLADSGIEQYQRIIANNKDEIAELIDQEDSREGKDASETLYRYQRASQKGIAVIQGWHSDSYREFFIPSKASLSAMSETYKDEIHQLWSLLINPALSYIFSFNRFVDILNEVYGIDISIIKADESVFIEQINNINNVIFTHYVNLHGTDEEKKEKRELYRSLFKPLSYEDNLPTEEALEEVTNTIDQLGTSKEAYKAYTDQMEQFIIPLLKSTPAFNGNTLHTVSLKGKA